MDLSIIVPVWNEEHKIGPDLDRLAAYCGKNRLKTEVIVSDDGSTDDTCSVVSARRQQLPDLIRLHCTGTHHGKGYAVREGILQSKGTYVMFMDCGGNVPLQYIEGGLALLQQDLCDLAHGSRHLPESRIERPMCLKRRMLSRLFRFMMRRYLGLPSGLTDTQCGFKLYRGDVARALYQQVTLEGFLFDIEVILLAMRNGFRIREFPISWSWDQDSRLVPGRILQNVVNDARYLKKRYRSGDLP